MVMEPPADPPWHRPVRRAVAAALAVEALGAVLLAGGVLLDLGRGRAAEPGGAAVLAAVTVALALALLLLARGVLRRRPGVRVPVLVWQVIQALTAVEGATRSPALVAGQLLLGLVAGVGVLLPGVLDPAHRRAAG